MRFKRHVRMNTDKALSVLLRQLEERQHAAEEAGDEDLHERLGRRREIVSAIIGTRVHAENLRRSSRWRELSGGRSPTDRY